MQNRSVKPRRKRPPEASATPVSPHVSPLTEGELAETRAALVELRELRGQFNRLATEFKAFIVERSGDLIDPQLPIRRIFWPGRIDVAAAADFSFLYIGQTTYGPFGPQAAGVLRVLWLSAKNDGVGVRTADIRIAVKAPRSFEMGKVFHRHPSVIGNLIGNIKRGVWAIKIPPVPEVGPFTSRN